MEHGGYRIISASDMDSRVASLWPSTISTDVLQRLPHAYPARMTFGHGGDSVIISASSELDPRAAPQRRPSMIVDILQGLARRFAAGANFSYAYGRTPAPAIYRLVMRYQMGVREYFDEHGAVTRVEYNDAYGPGRFGAVRTSEAEIARLRAATAGEVREKDCAVCLESFQEGEELRKMTCPSSHAFHEKCIFKWLRVSRICPLCRFALPAEHEEEDDEDEEAESDEETQEELEETDTEGDDADACTGANGRRLQEANAGSRETSTVPAEEEADVCLHRE